jgi:hypothetical protein
MTENTKANLGAFTICGLFFVAGLIAGASVS